MINEELGVRSEELAALLRGCTNLDQLCTVCPLRGKSRCSYKLRMAAADEIERLTKDGAKIENAE